MFRTVLIATMLLFCSAQHCFEGFCTEDEVELLEEQEVAGLRTELLQMSTQIQQKEENLIDAQIIEDMAETHAELLQMAGAFQRSQLPPSASLAHLRALAERQTVLLEESKEVKPAHEAKKPKHDNKILQEAMIPIGAFIAGGLLLLFQQTAAGLLALYFGGQAGFTLYMKVVLSNNVVSEQLGIKGVPAGFLVTAIQQVIAFLILSVIVLVLWFTPWAYTPRKLTNAKEVACVLLFSFSFALNIGLNNFSLSMLAISLNMIIRSCVPLVTLVLQQMMGPCVDGVAGNVKVLEVLLMCAGVACAGLATFAESHGSHKAGESGNLMLGILTCSLSDVAGALNLILASIFGSLLQPKLNPIDTIFYMAVPCGLFLLPVSYLMVHPVDWPGFGQLSDAQVLSKVMELSPVTIGWVLFSGAMAAGYNVLQYTVAQRLSASHAAFAGNFNKAATIMISICMGLEKLPGGIWSLVMLGAILGNILAFAGYSFMQVMDSKAPSKH